ncbi:MAG: HEAT repeat domain-containing protein [Myxococcales bacterium]|nr:HEAT repeat domain-containing protein [Myxococcales bacterium]
MLGLSPLPRTLAAALRDAGDKKTQVRVSALRDLARWASEGNREAVDRLGVVLVEDPAPGVRADAALALADAGARSAVAALVRCAKGDDEVRVRQMALLALGEVGQADDPEVAAVIERSLSAREPELRFQALIAHAHLLRESAEPALAHALGDDDAQVRYVALRLSEERWSDGDLPEALVSAAKAALDDLAAKVRLAAALLLGRAGDASGAEVIVAAIDSGRGADEPEDAAAAIEVAGRLGLTAARRGLSRRAFGLLGASRDPFAWQARVALARLGDERARQAIVRGLGAWSRDARTMAVAAAGSAGLREALPLVAAMRGAPDRAEESAVEEALALLSEPDRIDAAPDPGQDDEHDSAP